MYTVYKCIYIYIYIYTFVYGIHAYYSVKYYVTLCDFIIDIRYIL